MLCVNSVVCSVVRTVAQEVKLLKYVYMSVHSLSTCLSSSEFLISSVLTVLSCHCCSSAVFGEKRGLDLGSDENNLFVSPGAKVTECTIM